MSYVYELHTLNKTIKLLVKNLSQFMQLQNLNKSAINLCKTFTFIRQFYHFQTQI